MFIEAMILGLIIGIANNGRISNLFSLNIKYWYLIILGVLVQYSPLILKAFSLEMFNYNYFTVIGNLLLLIVLIMNLKIKGIFIILFGGVLNLAAFLLNGLKMPILESASSDKMINLIKTGNLVNYKIIEDLYSWKLYLGKIIKIPDFYIYTKSLSVGDVFIMIGLIILVAMEMKKTYFKQKGIMLRFPYN